MKPCTKCKVEKSLEEFSINRARKDGLDAWCKSCVCVKNRSWWENRSPEMKIRHRAKMKLWYLAHPQSRRLGQYGWTVEDYNRALNQQQGCCAICGRVLQSGNLSVAAAHIDHCHATGKVRGILCQSCNMAIGKFQDSVELLGKAIEYLNKHKTKPNQK